MLRFSTEALGLEGVYASTAAYIAEAMTPVDLAGFGLHRRRADDLCRAIYVTGEGSFLGPAATAQRFSDGAVIVRHGEDVRLLQPASFESLYRFEDGRPARVRELKRQAA